VLLRINSFTEQTLKEKIHFGAWRANIIVITRHFQVYLVANSNHLDETWQTNGYIFVRYITHCFGYFLLRQRLSNLAVKHENQTQCLIEFASCALKSRPSAPKNNISGVWGYLVWTLSHGIRFWLNTSIQKINKFYFYSCRIEADCFAQPPPAPTFTQWESAARRPVCPHSGESATAKTVSFLSEFFGAPKTR